MLALLAIFYQIQTVSTLAPHAQRPGDDFVQNRLPVVLPYQGRLGVLVLKNTTKVICQTE